LELGKGLSAVYGASLRLAHVAQAQQVTQLQEVFDTTTTSSTAPPQAAEAKRQAAVQGEDDARDWEAEMVSKQRCLQFCMAWHLRKPQNPGFFHHHQQEELMKLVALLPQTVRSVVESHPQMPELLEVGAACNTSVQMQMYGRPQQAFMSAPPVAGSDAARIQHSWHTLLILQPARSSGVDLGQQVVMDLGRPPLARFPDGDVRLSESPITQADLDYAVSQVRGS
jgi:hypothetical protein